QRNAMNVYQAVTIASIVQAEAATEADMGKVSRVIFNRLGRGMPLQMDSTLNYALNRSTLRTTLKDTRIDSPYNSYQRMGLPPTPIDSPGEAAMRAAINPTPGDWLYFVTVKPGDTRFTADYREHQRNVEEFNRNRRSASAAAR
ncbi:aminodeoxychorismate lyase, partial [Streptomyces leeuwenhoekii]